MEKLNEGRRKLVLAALASPVLGALPGCRASLPNLVATQTTPAAAALLKQSAEAHGAAAFAQLHDISVSYSGKWHRLVTKLQPALVDAGFRGGSDERILLGDQLVAQSHLGPKGHKQVVRHAPAQQRGEIQVWFNDQEAHDDERRAAAALVVDGYCLFLLGPLWIDKNLRAGRPFVMDVVGEDRVADGRNKFTCDLLRIRMRPGLGFSAEDQLELYIDRDTHLMKRVRLTLEGLESTRGALVEVDTFEPKSLSGVQWPTRFHERLLRPAPLKVHDWRLTGLDVDRGYGVADIIGSEFTGTAKPPAESFPKV